MPEPLREVPGVNRLPSWAQYIVALPLWALCVTVFIGIHLLYRVWEPLILVPILFWSGALIAAFFGTFRVRR